MSKEQTCRDVAFELMRELPGVASSDSTASHQQWFARLVNGSAECKSTPLGVAAKHWKRMAGRSTVHAVTHNQSLSAVEEGQLAFDIQQTYLGQLLYAQLTPWQRVRYHLGL